MSDADQNDPIARAKNAFVQKDVLAIIQSCEEALASDPQSREALFLLGIAAVLAKDPVRGMKVMEIAHRQHPDCRETVLALAGLSAMHGRLAEATYFAKLSMTLTMDEELVNYLPDRFKDPRQILSIAAMPRHLVEASIKLDLGDYSGAAREAEAGIQLDPRDADCLNVLGRALVKLGQFERALGTLRAAVHLSPEKPAFKADLADALIRAGQYDQGRAILEAVARGDDADLAMRLVDLAALDPRGTPDQLRQDAAGWTQRFGRAAAEAPAREDGPRRRIAIAYLINQAAVDRWLPAIELVLSRHDTSRFDIHVLQQYAHDENATVRLKKWAKSWREVCNVDDDTLEFMIEQMGLDAVIDMCGWSPNNRRALLGRHIAPVRISWLAEGPETIKGAIDYVLGDELTGELFRGEPVIVSAGGAVRYPVVPATAEPESPAARNGFVTFAAEAAPHRVLPSAPLWARVLEAVPGSVLLLGGLAIDDACARQFVEAFGNWGLASRIRIQEVETRSTAFTDMLSEADILLDSHPVTGGLNNCVALREGVPVVSMVGRTGTALGAGMLLSAERSDWIAHGDEEYVAIAARLAGDLPALAELRAGMRDGFATSALSDGRTLAANIEAAIAGLTAA